MFEFKTQENRVPSRNRKGKQLWLLDPRDQWAQGIPIKENYVNEASTVEEVLFEKQKACRRGYLAGNESCWTENSVTCKNSRKDGEKTEKKRQKIHCSIRKVGGHLKYKLLSRYLLNQMLHAYSCVDHKEGKRN